MGKDQVAIQPVTVINNFLLIHVSGREILSPGTGTTLNKNNMSSNQEVAQLKPNPVLKTQTCNKLILQ